MQIHRKIYIDGHRALAIATPDRSKQRLGGYKQSGHGGEPRIHAEQFLELKSLQLQLPQ